jgi:hypothetical protein
VEGRVDAGWSALQEVVLDVGGRGGRGVRREELGCWDLLRGGGGAERRGKGTRAVKQGGRRAAVARLEVLGVRRRRGTALAGHAGDGELGDGGGVRLGVGARRVRGAASESPVEWGVVVLASGEEVGLLVGLLLPAGVSWLGSLRCDSRRLERVRPHRQRL